MKKRELKTLWKFARLTWVSSFIFWILETITFLIIEGWHYKATNPIEIFCDKVVHNLWIVALNVTLYVLFNYLFRLNKKTN